MRDDGLRATVPRSPAASDSSIAIEVKMDDDGVPRAGRRNLARANLGGRSIFATPNPSLDASPMVVPPAAFNGRFVRSLKYVAAANVFFALARSDPAFETLLW
jgi:hypothetical protein